MQQIQYLHSMTLNIINVVGTLVIILSPPWCSNPMARKTLLNRWYKTPIFVDCIKLQWLCSFRMNQMIYQRRSRKLSSFWSETFSDVEEQDQNGSYNGMIEALPIFMCVV